MTWPRGAADFEPPSPGGHLTLPRQAGPCLGVGPREATRSPRALLARHRLLHKRWRRGAMRMGGATRPRPLPSCARLNGMRRRDDLDARGPQLALPNRDPVKVHRRVRTTHVPSEPATSTSRCCQVKSESMALPRQVSSLALSLASRQVQSYTMRLLLASRKASPCTCSSQHLATHDNQQTRASLEIAPLRIRPVWRR